MYFILACGYVLGNSMTLADVDFLSTYSTLEACNFINLDCFKNLKMWADRMKQQIPKYSENCGKGAEAFGNWFNSNFDRKQAWLYLELEFMKKPSGHSVKSLLFNLSNLNLKFIKKNSTIWTFSHQIKYIYVYYHLLSCILYIYTIQYYDTQKQ